MAKSHQPLWYSLLLAACVATSVRAQSTCPKYPEHIVVKEIGAQAVMEYTLSPEISRQINETYGGLTLDPYKNWEAYKAIGLDIIERYFPNDLQAIIKDMRTKNYPTALVIHNFPVDTVIPPTPTDGHRPPAVDKEGGKGYISEAMIFGMCNFMGAFPEFDEQERDGTMINQIIPRDEAEFRDKVCSYGSDLEFGIHTENCYQEPPLKFFSLLCLRGDPKVNTSIVFLEHIMQYIKDNYKNPTEMFTLLSQPLFAQKTGPSFRNAFKQTVAPVLTTNEKDEIVFRLNTTYTRTEGTTREAHAAIEWLKQAITSQEFKDKYYTKVNLKRGDFLLFNNWEVMHGRDAFTIDKDNWRWLQRCYFMLNEHRHSSDN